MKNLPRLIVCILAMCTATVDVFSQCPAANSPDIQIQWRNNNAYDFGHRAMSSNFLYDFDFGTVDEQLSAIQQIQFYNCATTTQPSTKFTDDNSFYKIVPIYCAGTSAADWDLGDLIDNASTLAAVTTG